MALSTDTPRVYESGVEPIFNDLPVYESTTIYEGSAVGEVSTGGVYRALVAADTFAGFAHEQADNSSGSSSDINVKVRQRGVVKLTVVGASGVTDNGVSVYASDDGTFTLTASGSSSIGKVNRWVSGTTCMVYFEADKTRSL